MEDLGVRLSSIGRPISQSASRHTDRKNKEKLVSTNIVQWPWEKKVGLMTGAYYVKYTREIICRQNEAKPRASVFVTELELGMHSKVCSVCSTLTGIMH